MSTNLTRLRNTARMAYERWRDERVHDGKNEGSEGLWSLLVVEPILKALGWPRLRQGQLHSTGAYFEWPKKNCLDVALIHVGRPLVIVQLKDTLDRSRQDITNALKREPTKSSGVGIGLTSWFKDEPGFCRYQVTSDKPPACDWKITLAEVIEDPGKLATVAAHVLTDRKATSGEHWLNEAVSDDRAVEARFSPRAIQDKFLKKLAEKLEIRAPLKPRLRIDDYSQPSPTYVYVDLPGVLPDNRGVVFNIDTTVNKIKVLFYNNSRCKCDETDDHSFDDAAIPTDSFLEEFIVQHAIPLINKWRS